MSYAREIIRQNEGCRLNTYIDATGNKTIGWGRKLPKASTLTAITQALADEWLDEDIALCETDLQRLVKVGLNANQSAALVDFTYNLGLGCLAGSTLLRKLNKGDYEGAGNEFLKWDMERVDGIAEVVKGLAVRRAWEKLVWELPEGGPLPERPDVVYQTEGQPEARPVTDVGGLFLAAALEDNAPKQQEDDEVRGQDE
jgi:lysozyme